MAYRYNLENFTGGWFMGNFEPSLLKNDNFEIAVKRFAAGSIEPLHFQRTAVEFTIVISGHCILAGIKCGPNDIIKIDPLELADFQAIEDCVLISIKYPSIPNDKVIGLNG
jgi:hypothetical protein